MTRYVFGPTRAVRYRFPTHANDLLMDRSEAHTSEVFIVILEPGEGPPRHSHPDYEQIFYLLEGTGRLEIGQPPESHAVQAGDLVRIPPNTPHRIVGTGSGPTRYLSVDAFLQDRASRPEPTWESHVQAMCETYGWDIRQIRSVRGDPPGEVGPGGHETS